VTRLARILPDAAGPLRSGLAVAVLAGAAAGLATIVQARALSRAIDAAFLRGASVAALVPALVLLAGLALLRAALAWAQEGAAQKASSAVRVAVRDRVLRHVLARGPRLLHGERTGEVANTLTVGVEALDAYVAQYLPQAALAAVVPTLVLAAVAAADPLSGLVLLLTFPLVPLFLWLIGSAADERARAQWVLLSRLAARFLDALGGLATLRAFGRAEDEAKALASAGDRHRRATMEVLRLAFVSALVLEALATLGTAVVAVEVGLRVLYGRLEFAPALGVLVLAPEFYRPLRAFGAAFHAGTAGRAAASRLAALATEAGPTAAPGLLDPSPPAPRPSPAPSSRPPTIRYANVVFAYADGPRALDGLTLEIPAGSTVALVGPTGAGKTTVASLLLRFLEPSAGRLYADAEPLDGLSPEEWRRRVAWVPQRPRLLHGTLRENLLLARPGAPESELRLSLRRARLDALVEELPDGLDTHIGEGGARLSGGEGQRLALARAFLKDAPVLVLDEPTAQLDAETEAELVESLRDLQKGRTVLLVAHRLATAAAADRVAVLAAGRIVEDGPQRDLACAGRFYTRLLAAAGAP
jgi:ATP-binding cassette subfamily C protein CydD